MKILFNKIINNPLNENQKLLQKPFREHVVEVSEPVNFLGVSNWTGFSSIIVNEIEYELPTNKSFDQYFIKLQGQLYDNITIAPSRFSGISKLGTLFLGVSFDKLKCGKVESRKILTTNKIKKTLTGINYVSTYGVQFLEYSAQCPPLLNIEYSKLLIDLLKSNNNRNVLIQFECSEFGENESIIYAHLDSSIIATQGLNIYGTKVKITERF